MIDRLIGLGPWLLMLAWLASGYGAVRAFEAGEIVLGAILGAAFGAVVVLGVVIVMATVKK